MSNAVSKTDKSHFVSLLGNSRVDTSKDQPKTKFVNLSEPGTSRDRYEVASRASLPPKPEAFRSPGLFRTFSKKAD